MKKLPLIIFGLTTALNTYAINVIDVYGVDRKQASQIEKTYGQAISKIEDQAMNRIKNSTNHEVDTKDLHIAKDKLIASMKKEQGLIYVNWETTFYGKDNFNTTVEVIKKGDKKRLKYVKPQLSKQEVPIKKDDIISDVVKYNSIGMDLFVNNKLNEPVKSCEFYYCTMGFNHPQLMPYLSTFKKAEHNKAYILKVLKNDPDTNRRVAAVLLVGSFKKPENIIKQLYPYVTDASAEVRNAAMPVIYSTMIKAKINKINPKPFVELLDSPHTNDRNNALITLLAASDAPKTQKILMKNRDTLIRILALKLSYNNETAYHLLKKISKQNYGQQDITAWEKWSLNQA